MKEHFVTYTQALALKKIGFDEPCIARYIIPGDLVFKGCYEYSNIIHLELTQNDICEAHVLAPLKSQVFKWFRDEHKLIAYIQYYAEWNFEIFRIDDKIAEVQDDVCFDYTFKGGTYEEAESACIDTLIEIIKEKKS